MYMYVCIEKMDNAQNYRNNIFTVFMYNIQLMYKLDNIINKRIDYKHHIVIVQ